MKTFRACAFVVISSLLAGAASAHEAGAAAGGFASGFSHPLHGWDHVVAMVAVGLWAGLLGRRAVLALPLLFPVAMAVGAAIGASGVQVPATETGIALSAVVIGGMVALAVRSPLWIAALLVGAFALCHGYAHGVELPATAGPVAYGLGFMVATGLLHLAGVAFGLLARWPAGKAAVRGSGALIALAGLASLSAL